MSWNYRIVKYFAGDGYGLHEVHYDADGKETHMTENPAAFVGDTPQEVVSSIIMARTDAMRRPVFDQPKDWVDDSDSEELAEYMNILNDRGFDSLEEFNFLESHKCDEKLLRLCRMSRRVKQALAKEE